MKNAFLAIPTIALLLSGCGGKDITIEPNKVKEILTAYGAENTETEILIHTDKGDMKAKLYTETPLHRANFIRLIKNGWYKKGNFYRVIRSFMVQGGNTTRSKPAYTIPAEIQPSILHKKGSLAMARFDENNPEMNSSPTEFYIVQGRRFLNEDLDDLRGGYPAEQLKIFETIGGAPNLDGKYTVFGEITEGMEVLEKLANVETYGADVPVQKVEFSIEILK
jgi:peptidyl-prolyl cis-trans isomerase B (cyclophilin B)